ncbi:MAG: DUF1461 domain-containing protein [Candidatus Limiplasma sp.]|nr:DUF1461 domain-containing protein [Candidatus Limiplasma sp.]MEA5145460.1 DUF1461 domain-containing protein [Candidatus Limiplasma sp.]
MAQDERLGNIPDTLKDRFGEKIDPSKVFSEGNLKKKRGAFWTCFLIGLLLVLLSLGVALGLNVTRVDLLKQGVDTHVVATGILSQSDADAFVTDTLDYLTGIKSLWEPAVTIGGFRVGVPEAFKAHMATVKGWVDSAKAILLAGAAIVLLLLSRVLVGVKGSRRSPFSVGGYYLGAAIPLLLLVGVGVWGYLDFDSLWAWVHTVFIPDGIFSATEQIMQLFPVEVFSGYLQPVAISFGIGAGIVLALPLLLWPLSKLLTALFGKAPARRRTGSRTAKRTTGSRSSRS